MHRDHILAAGKAAILGEGRPPDLARAVLVFRHRDEKTLGDAAFVARAGRNAKAADVAQEHAHEAADAAVGLAADAHHALAVIEIELLDDGPADDHHRLPSRRRSAVLDAEQGIAHRLDN